jgi:RNA polymerase sigma-70 factor, ECF subfamily
MPDDRATPAPVVVGATTAEPGSDGTWQDLFLSHWRLVYSIGLGSSGNRHDAEDLTQETFTRVLRHWHRIRDRETDLRAYVVTVALNLARDRVREAQRRGPGVPLASAAVEWPDPDAGPEEQVIRALERAGRTRAVMEALIALEEGDQQVLVLRILCGMSAKDVGERINKSAAAVRQQQHRALVALRRQMGATENDA